MSSASVLWDPADLVGPDTPEIESSSAVFGRSVGSFIASSPGLLMADAVVRVVRLPGAVTSAAGSAVATPKSTGADRVATVTSAAGSTSAASKNQSKERNQGATSTVARTSAAARSPSAAASASSATVPPVTVLSRAIRRFLHGDAGAMGVDSSVELVRRTARCMAAELLSGEFDDDSGPSVNEAARRWLLRFL